MNKLSSGGLQSYIIQGAIWPQNCRKSQGGGSSCLNTEEHDQEACGGADGINCIDELLCWNQGDHDIAGMATLMHDSSSEISSESTVNYVLEVTLKPPTSILELKAGADISTSNDLTMYKHGILVKSGGL